MCRTPTELKSLKSTTFGPMNLKPMIGVKECCDHFRSLGNLSPTLLQYRSASSARVRRDGRFTHTESYDSFTMLWKIIVLTITHYCFLYHCEQLLLVQPSTSSVLSLNCIHFDNSMAEKWQPARQKCWLAEGRYSPRMRMEMESALRDCKFSGILDLLVSLHMVGWIQEMGHRI
jgi:hypothetical protein